MPEEPTHKLTLYFTPEFGDPIWAGLDYELAAPQQDRGEWMLGRSPTAQITLNLRTISVKHALISYSYGNDSWLLTDLGSHNATRLNGQPIPPRKPQPIKVGDRIDLGPNARIQVVENSQDTIPEDLGPPTIASTTPLATLPPEPAPAPPPTPKTEWDSLYLALQWLMSGTSMADRFYRLVVFAGLGALFAWLLSLYLTR